MGEKENLKQKNNGEEKPVFQTIKQLSTFIDKNLKDLSNQFQLAENKLKGIRAKFSQHVATTALHKKDEIEKVTKVQQSSTQTKLEEKLYTPSQVQDTPTQQSPVASVQKKSDIVKNKEEKNTYAAAQQTQSTVVQRQNIETRPVQSQNTTITKSNSENKFAKKSSDKQSQKPIRERQNAMDNGQRRKNPNFPSRTNTAVNGRPTGNTNFKTTGTAKNFTAPIAPPPVVNTKQPSKKKTFEKQYSEQKKLPLTKRALIRQQVSIDDFDENKSGYRKLRTAKKPKEQQVQSIKIEHAVVTTENIPLKVLSEKLGIPAVEITKRLFKEGIIKTINDSIDYDTAAYIASDLNIQLEYKPEKTAEETLTEIYKEQTAGQEKSVIRPPIVTVMGHVDHGKTSLLDKIRQTNVTSGEVGGITQHIGAYSVKIDGKVITFLDTPGHEAFTAMRARGAMATDIVILVVAADDGIMPQTIEAINHALAAEVPIIVAINKMDKPEANLDRVKQGLTQYGLTPEEWGGDTILCPISAKTGQGIHELLQTINLVAEIKDLKANPDSMAKGLIIEAKLDKGKGPVASVLIQNGTLRIGDSIISGTTIGKVRAMIDDQGKSVKEVGPSIAVSILGLEEVPNAGDSIIAVEQDKLLKQVLVERKRRESEALSSYKKNVTLADVFGKIAEGKLKGLNIIVKADVQGSVEAVKHSLLKLSNDEVRVNIVHSGAGAVTESDVMLADSTNSVIVGFNVRPDTKAKTLIDKQGIDFRAYRIIYELLEDVQKALKGMLAPKYQEIFMGKCNVLQTFKITGLNTVAGCYVTEGKIVRNGKLRIYRDNILIVEGSVHQLKRFKDDVKEVSGGFECGVSIDGFDEIRVGDVIECFIIQEVPA